MNHTLAAAALALWEAEVRRFAPDEHLRWQRLLQLLPDPLPPDQLRDALAPIAAKNDKEQALFTEIFERAVAQTAALTEADGEGLISPPTPPPSFWKKYAPWLIAAAVAGVALLVWLYVGEFSNLGDARATESLPDTIRLYRQVAAGAETTLCPDSALLARLGGVQSASFGNPAATWGRTGRSRNLRFGTATLDNAGCLRYAALPNTAGRDTVRYRLNVGEVSNPADVRRVTVEAVVEVAKPTFGPKPITYIFFEQPPPYDHDPLLRAMQFEEADPLTRALARWAWLIRLGALAAAAALLAWWVLWRARKRQKLVAQRDKNARPPYVWPIRIPDLHLPEPGEAFGPALNALRRRAADEHLLLDLPATVRATVRRGGMARFVFRRQSRPPEYLLLVDRADPRDHRARFYDDLYRLLRQNEVLAVRFFFDGDARLCHNDEYPDGLGLDELLFRYPHHRLLVIGDGRRWFSATTGRLAPWTEQLARWKDRALLSTLPAADWGRRERALGARFRFAPATVAGLRVAVEFFESDEADARLPDPARMAPLAMPAPVALGEGGDLLQALEEQLPDEDTRVWLAACALWPELHYDLTCWLGAWLEQDTGRPLLTFARLSDLLRLPWFASGEMPDPARAALLDWLRQTRPGLEIRLREALYVLLEQHGPPADSAAWNDYGLHLAFNQWLTATDPKTKKALEAQIARWIDAHGAPDFITVRELSGRPGPLDQILPDAWKKRLFKGRIPALGLRDTWRDGLRAAAALAALALGLYLGWQPQAPECAGEKADIRLATETLRVCADSEAERALLLEYLLRQAAAEGDTARFDSLLNQRGNITLDTLSRANVANSAYNAALPDYRVADSLRQTQPGYRADTSDYRRRACAWFYRAAVADVLPRRSGMGLPWVQRAADWCARPNEQARIDIRPSITGRVLNSATGAPLPGVRVQGPATDLRTDAAGQYTLRLPPDYPSPRIALRFSKEGYRAQTAYLSVEATDTLPDLRLVEIPRDVTPDPGSAIEPEPATPPVATVPDPTTPQTDPVGTPTGGQSALPLPDPIRKLEADMVAVAGGTFTMGCQDEKRDGQCDDDEKPARQVRVRDFEIGRYEVTQAQWRAVMGSDPPELYNTGCDECPVEGVSWNDIQDFLKKLNALTGKSYRLPSEAEWEYAARGGSKSSGYLYSGSNNLDAVGWYNNNHQQGNTFGAKKTTRPVGKKKDNELGLYDMSGNVYEWCQDWFGGYPSENQTNPRGPAEGSSRVFRGGSWNVVARICRVSNRNFGTPDYRGNGIGFRLASAPQ
jgi:formylglycine-generating enzyme required for sulfatase activity